MKVTTLLGALAVASLAAAGAGYAWQLHQELAALSKRVTTLTVELASMRDAGGLPAPAVHEAPTFLVQAAAPTVAPVPDAKIREVVRGELAQREEAQQAVLQADEEQLADRLRDSLSESLALDADTLARIETLGDDLSAIERSLLTDRDAHRITEPEAHARYLKAWNDDESKLQSLLGDDRYRKLVALRGEHPEFARAVYVLRSAPSTLLPQKDEP